jgi:hypothetical protein
MFGGLMFNVDQQMLVHSRKASLGQQPLFSRLFLREIDVFEET